MFVSYILSKVRAYMRYRDTVRELSLLSDRELDDLGISRFQIEKSLASTLPRKSLLRCSIRPSPAIWRAFACLEAVSAHRTQECWRR